MNEYRMLIDGECGVWERDDAGDQPCDVIGEWAAAVRKHKYKTTTAIIGDLVDIVSKNGAVLLNIGPKPDGTIPAPEEKMLLEIGEWEGQEE